MKIKGTCRSCHREFYIEQAATNGGRCPWCGVSFQAHYAAVLVDLMRDAQTAGGNLENALEKMGDMAPGFDLDRESVLARIRANLDRLERPSG